MQPRDPQGKIPSYENTRVCLSAAAFMGPETMPVTTWGTGSGISKEATSPFAKHGAEALWNLTSQGYTGVPCTGAFDRRSDVDWPW